MARKPRPPREIERSSDQADPTVAGPNLVRRVDPRQTDLFAPTFIEPCKPTLAQKVPAGERWQYEIKHDGYRVQCHLRDAEVRIFTKGGHDWTERMPGIVAGLEALQVRSAILDGEAVIEGEDFVTDFFALHAALAKRHAPDAILYAFDLLELDGEYMRQRPLVERRAALARALFRAPAGIEFSPHHSGNGEAMLKHVCAMGLEGIVAKRTDAPYRSGRSDTWLKIKRTETAPFAVIGYEADRSGVRSLRLARLVEGALIPIGSVGAGFDRETARALWRALESGSPVVVDVEYRGWTPAGELRHAVLKGWHAG